MTHAADAAGVKTMLPFTYTYFPMLRYAAHLVQQGYIGTPRHLNWRAYSSLALNGEAMWRFDRRIGGEGVLADIGSHAIAVARMVFGDITHVSAQFAAFIQRDGIPMEHLASDYASLQIVFANGARGTITVSMATFEPMQGGIRQALELSGSTGTLHYTNDFATRVSLQGAQLGDPSIADIDVPETFWAPQISRANPRDMYFDLFNKSDAMAREFVSAIAAQRPVNGQTFRDGLAVQRVIDGAVESANNDGILVVT
jgi:predicted dehydrogenase